MSDLIDHKVRAFLDIEENGPYTAPDGSVMRIDPPPEFEVDIYRAYYPDGSLCITAELETCIKYAKNRDGFVLHWTRRPGEKFATPELVWPKEEDEQ